MSVYCLGLSQSISNVQKTDLVYLDPPYQGVCGNRDSRYLAGIDFDEFVLALESLNDRGIRFVISYDGKLGNKTFGQILPERLALKRIEIEVGRSSQSTLLGRAEKTIESLYLSPNLIQDKLIDLSSYRREQPRQLTLV
jgi:DNA adenine methylase